MAKETDMEKGMQQAIGAAADAQVPLPPMTGKGEKKPLLPNLQVQPVEGCIVVACKMNPGLKKWPLLYWIIACSVVVLINNSTHAGLNYKTVPLEAAAMVVFLCAICFIFGTMLSR